MVYDKNIPHAVTVSTVILRGLCSNEDKMYSVVIHPIDKIKLDATLQYEKEGNLLCRVMNSDEIESFFANKHRYKIAFQNKDGRVYEMKRKSFKNYVQNIENALEKGTIKVKKKEKQLTELEIKNKEYALYLREKGITLQEVADLMNQLGYKAKKGGLLTSNQIKRIIEK